MRRLAWLAVLVAGTASGCSQAEGHGERTPRFETVVQDDALLLHTPRELPRTLATLRSLGVDRVRINATWAQIAPHPESRRRPRFDAADPGAYHPRAWLNLDRAVEAVTDAGLKAMIDVAFFAPRWAVPGGVGRPETYRELPDAREFGLFAEAVARRYPRVRLWTTWNEPNHPTFLTPQWRAGVPVAAHHYRRMHELGYAAIKRVSAENRVLMGGLSSIGSDGRGRTSAIRPLRFLREMACVDQRLRALARPECRGFRPLRADGFAHHPYMHRQAPDQPLPHPDSVGMADLGRLSRLLAQLAERGRIVGRLPVYVTEFGYETDPPDPGRGVSLQAQPDLLQRATAEALARPDVRMHAQFLLRDLPQDELYQTGLVEPGGRPKPALLVFPVHFAVRRGVGLGVVRPGAGRRRVALERRRGGGGWATVGSAFLTDRDGVVRRAGLGRGVYRLRWEPGGDAPARRSLPAAAR